ncbi:hypothetical protein DFH09DRAFT_1087166 [Mycena vulgaris]|nr:hypothetical protein DFH09DRAFT_1087166 [Mycena vulgaris]
MVKFRCCRKLRSKNSGRPKAPIKAILEQEKLGNMKEGWRGQFKKRILSTKDKTIVKQDNPGRRGEMIHEGRDERGLLNEDCRLKLGSLNLGKMNFIIKSRHPPAASHPAHSDIRGCTAPPRPLIRHQYNQPHHCPHQDQPPAHVQQQLPSASSCAILPSPLLPTPPPAAGRAQRLDAQLLAARGIERLAGEERAAARVGGVDGLRRAAAAGGGGGGRESGRGDEDEEDSSVRGVGRSKERKEG